MIERPEKIKGKTYSLFGNYETTDEFYKLINDILIVMMEKYNDEYRLLGLIQKASVKKKYYYEFIEENKILKESESIFNNFIFGVNKHINEQSIFKFWKSDLKTKQWQYYLYMIEFAVTNKIFKERFLECSVKIALLPHCLKDLTKQCKAEINGLDYQCKHCSRECFINEASKILKENGIEPYIWMSADLKKMAKKNFAEKKSLGVLGIACIPQLIRGMRMCREKNIPVVGMPLDANRCIRWMGDFYPNSINLKELKSILNKK